MFKGHFHKLPLCAFVGASSFFITVLLVMHVHEAVLFRVALTDVFRATASHHLLCGRHDDYKHSYLATTFRNASA
jgi:hypothetical protein